MWVAGGKMPAVNPVNFNNDILARFTHGRKSGMSIMWVSIHSLIEGPLHKRKQMPDTKSSQELTAGELTGLKGEPAPTVLLCAHTARLLSNFVSLYPQISTALRAHQRSPLVWWTMVSTGTRSRPGNKCQWSDQLQMRYLYHPPHEAQGPLQKGRERVLRARSQALKLEWNRVFWTVSLLHSRTHSDYRCPHKACRTSSQSAL